MVQGVVIVNEAKRKPLYQPWSEEEFRADYQVMAMTPLQRWMYRTLLQAAFFHSSRPYLPDDDAQLWMLAGCENENQWQRNKIAVRAAFTPVQIDDTRLLSRKRLVEDWTRIMDKRQALAEAGRKGGKANAKPELSKCLPDARLESSKEVKGSEVREERKDKTNTAPQTGAVAVDLPDWLPVKEWNGYLKMRQRIRKPATVEAMRLAIAELDRLRAAGNDPKLVLEQSILNSWQGVFELRLSREDRARLEDAYRNRDAMVGSNRNPGPEPAPILTPEQEEQIEKARWKQLEAGTLPVSAETVAWVNAKRTRLKGEKFAADDPRPSWFRKFFNSDEARA